MRQGNKGQGLILVALLGLLIVGGISAWLLLAGKPESQPTIQRPTQNSDARVQR